MAEDNNNISKEEIKNEAKETVNKAREEFKSTSFKEETGKGKDLFNNLVKSPISTIKNVVNDEQNNYFTIAIILIFIWFASNLIKYFIYVGVNEYVDFSFLELLKDVLSPICAVLAFSGATYFLNKDKKGQFTNNLTVATVVFIPYIIVSILGFLNYISDGVRYLTNPIDGVLKVIAVVLQFFAVKEMFGKEDNEEAFKEFVKVEGVYYIVYFVLSFLGIYI